MTDPDAVPPIYNWPLIEADYKAGVLPVPAIVKKYAPLTTYLLLKQARLHNWKRMPPTDSEEVLGAAARHVLDPEAALIFDPEFLRRAALISAATVVETHRSDIAKLRHLEQTLLERFSLYLTGTISNLPFRLERESPTEILGKLAGVMRTRIELERQSFGLSAYMPRDNDEPSVASEVRAMMERIDKITAEKALPAVPKEPMK